MRVFVMLCLSIDELQTLLWGPKSIWAATSEKCGGRKTYKDTPIQIYKKNHLQKLKIFR